MSTQKKAIAKLGPLGASSNNKTKAKPQDKGQASAPSKPSSSSSSSSSSSAKSVGRDWDKVYNSSESASKPSQAVGRDWDKVYSSSESTSKPSQAVGRDWDKIISSESSSPSKPVSKSKKGDEDLKKKSAVDGKDDDDEDEKDEDKDDNEKDVNGNEDTTDDNGDHSGTNGINGTKSTPDSDSADQPSSPLQSPTETNDKDQDEKDGVKAEEENEGGDATTEKGEEEAGEGEEGGEGEEAEESNKPKPAASSKKPPAKKRGGKSGRAVAARAAKIQKAKDKAKGKSSTTASASKPKANGKESDDADTEGGENDVDGGENGDDGGNKPKPKASATVEKKVDKKKVDKKVSLTAKEMENLKNARVVSGALLSRPTAKDVKIGGFSLSSFGKDLMKDTELELSIGRRYGLLGANGSGKTTLLKSLAARELPIPSHIDIYLLEEEAPSTNMTALEYVVDAMKKEFARLEKEADRALEKEGPDSESFLDATSRLENLEPETVEPRAGRLLFGLGFDKGRALTKTKDLSGGWRMRVALARALLIRPTLLLLDEPTNHLDLNSCVWLESYLAKYDRCLVVISHSQDFLNAVCTNILHITPTKKLRVYGGNYDTFIKTKEEQEINQMKRYKKEQEDIQHIKQFMASCGTYANLVRQGKSKMKIIEKMEARGLTEAVVEEKAWKFAFQPCGKLPPPVLAFYNVGFAYSGDMKGGLYKGLNLGVDLDSRVALVGPNGAGKSTLLKLIAGELVPTEGMIRRHGDLRIARYNQHTVDILDLKQPALSWFRSKFPAMPLDEQGWRGHIGKYGVSGREQLVPMSMLSDGQKSRIILAYLATKSPHLLLLDEPTNHLDIPTIDSLAEAINGFEGGLILVSHDFRLIKQVAKEIWVCDNKNVQPFKGDIWAYKRGIVKQQQIAEERFNQQFKQLNNK